MGASQSMFNYDYDYTIRTDKLSLPITLPANNTEQSIDSKLAALKNLNLIIDESKTTN